MRKLKISETVRAHISVVIRAIILGSVFFYAVWQTMLSLWQIEICFLYQQIGWQTDIAGTVYPIWYVVQYYMDKILFAWILTFVVVCLVWLWSEWSSAKRKNSSI